MHYRVAHKSIKNKLYAFLAFYSVTKPINYETKTH